MTNNFLPIGAETAEQICALLRDNVPVSEIAERLHVKPQFVTYLEHCWIQNELLCDDSERSQTITELVSSDNEAGEKIAEQIRNSRQQEAMLLMRNGLSSSQIAIETKLSMSNLDTIAKHERKKSESPEAEKNIFMRNSLYGRIVLALFVNHYRSICALYDKRESDTDDVAEHNIKLEKAVEACMRVHEDMLNSMLNWLFGLLSKKTRHSQLFEHDERYLALGTLISAANVLEKQSHLPKHIQEAYSRRQFEGEAPLFIVEEVCHNKDCGQRFAYALKHASTSSNCPFCELRERTAKLFRNLADKTETDSEVDTQTAQAEAEKGEPEK